MRGTREIFTEWVRGGQCGIVELACDLEPEGSSQWLAITLGHTQTPQV